MKFFIDNLGGRDLFNIYFENNQKFLGATEASYKNFFGARDLNIRVQEGAETEIFLLKMTNVTYYVMGVMLLLRKILLWFLLFVSPFLALLMPFILIKNTGWIWIGVFFQWLFYGPLLALFLGATSTIWKAGIPFNFDFSRVTSNAFQPSGYVYPSGINIVYGGPGQNDQFGRIINRANNGNYVDTFAEYVITLIMLWAVTFFPWWLLRIFRDYCCEGIYAMRNILMAMYDQMRAPSPKGGIGPSGPGATPTVNIGRDTPIKTNVTISLGSLQSIQKTISRDLAKGLNLSATRMTDVARLETNSQMKQTVMQNLAYLANPVKAQVPAERQQYMNLRSELFNRAIKSDSIAQTMLASTSTSATEKLRIREEIIKSLPQKASISQMTTEKVKLSKDKVYTITNNYTQTVINNNKTVNSIARNTNTTTDQVKNILSSYSQHTAETATQIIQSVVRDTHIHEHTVKEVLAQNGAIGRYVTQIHETAMKESIPHEQITKVINNLHSLTSTQSTVQQISQELQIPPVNVKMFISQAYSTITSQPENVEQIAETTNVNASQVNNILTSYISHIDEPHETVIQNIAQSQSLTTQKVNEVIQSAQKVMQASPQVKIEAEKAHISQDKVSQILEKTSTQISSKSIVQQVSQDLKIPAESIKQFISETYTTLVSQPQTIENIATTTKVSSAQVHNILTSYASQVDKPQKTIIQNIAQNEKMDTEQVSQVIKTANTTINTSPILQTEATKNHIPAEDAPRILAIASAPTTQKEGVTQPVVKVISYKSNISEDSSKHIFENIMNQAVTNEHIVSTVQKETGLLPQQVKNVITTFTQNSSQPTQVIIDKINQSSGIPKDKVRSVLESTSETVLATNDIVHNVAEKEGMKEEDVANTIQTQMDLASKPEEHIEQTITIPPSVSIEDYEQVKDMWTKHYEKGEIPVSDQIKSRGDWIEQEIVYITNTLNKILSSDENLRQEGLDELGFLLPIFLINNLKGEELVIYLKAKLEAAKLVQKLLTKEEEVKAEYEEKDKEEVFVDVAEKKEEANDLHMDLEEDENKTPQSIEDRVQAVQEKLTQIEEDSQKAEEPKELDSIRNKLQEKAENSDAT
jgi:hypothetical protein